MKKAQETTIVPITETTAEAIPERTARVVEKLLVRDTP